MGQGFEPQAVCAKSVGLWFKNGLELTGRKPGHFVILVGCFAGIHYLPEIISNNMFVFVMPILLGAGCIIADSSNQKTFTLQEIRNKPIAIWLRLLLLGIIPWIPIIIISLIGSVLLGPGDDLLIEKYDGYDVFEGGSAILAIMFFWFITMGYFLWFMVPLISIEELPLGFAFEQAMDALGLNRFVVGLVVFLSFSCFFGMLSSVLVFPWIAVVTSMMYISYRHIWYGDSGITEKSKCLIDSSVTVANLS